MDSRRRSASSWAAPQAPGLLSVRGLGPRQWTRAGSARTCSFPRPQPMRRSSVPPSDEARGSAGEARRSPGAASAAGHPVAVRAEAQPIEAVHLVNVLDLAPQLSCAETGRTAWGRRPTSLSMGMHAGLRARNDRLRRRGTGLSQAKRVTCCWRGDGRRGSPYEVLLVGVLGPAGGHMHSGQLSASEKWGRVEAGRMASQ